MSFGDPKHDFPDVELAPNVGPGSHFFIESAATGSLMTTSLLLVTFLVIHVIGAFRAPLIYAHREEFFSINATNDNASYDVDVTLSKLQLVHRFVVLNASLVRSSADTEKFLPVDLNTRTTTLKDGKTIAAGSEVRSSAQAHFAAGQPRSYYMHVVRVPIADLDEVQIRLTAATDFSGITGFFFRWDFFTPSADKYIKLSKVLLSVLIGYMLIVFSFYLHFDSEVWSQVYIIVLGILGVFLCNPITYLLPRSPTAPVTDHILLSLFVAVFRLFLVLELEMLRGRKHAPGILLTVFLALFFAFYATIDAAAAYDRKCHILQSDGAIAVVLQTESALMVLDGVYVAFSLLYLLMAGFSNNGNNPRRLLFFALAVVATGGITVFSHVYAVWADMVAFSVLPQMLFTSVHVTFAAMAIFMLHTSAGEEYEDINAKEEPMVLDIEQASGTAIVAEVEEEDDDEEEEEEE
jgi:hypothetical protein